MVRLVAGTQTLKLVVWDTTGQERFVTLNSCFYNATYAAILAYDITNRDSFEKVTFWLNSLRIHEPEAAAVLVGTKLDLEDKREVSYCEGALLGERLGVPFLETSAKTNTNVRQAFPLLLTILA